MIELTLTNNAISLMSHSAISTAGAVFTGDYSQGGRLQAAYRERRYKTKTTVVLMFSHPDDLEVLAEFFDELADAELSGDRDGSTIWIAQSAARKCRKTLLENR